MALGVKRVEAKGRLESAVHTVDVLDLTAVELRQVVQFENVEDTFERPVEKIFL